MSKLIEAIAFDVNQPAGLNRKRRLEDHQDILFICPVLVEIYPREGPRIRMDEVKLFLYARIAHYSVQQYLLSSCTRLEKPAEFSLDSFTAYKEILHICLIYLLDDQLWDRCQDTLEKVRGKTHEEKVEKYLELEEEYPLANFAARKSFFLYKKVSHQTEEFDCLVLKLLEEQRAVQAWTVLKYPIEYLLLSSSLIPQSTTPVYYASLLGLTRILKIIMGLACPGRATGGASPSSLKVDRCCDINADGLEGSPLTVAISHGHAEIVRLLLDMGADVNGAGKNHFYRPLPAAIMKGDEELVHELLEKGAKVYHRDGLAQSSRNSEGITRLLREYRGDDKRKKNTSYRSSVEDIS